jgi:hypothetical protein
VRLESSRSEALIRKGNSAAQRLPRARILLMADVSGAGEAWSDSRIIRLGHQCFHGLPGAQFLDELMRPSPNDPSMARLVNRGRLRRAYSFRGRRQRLSASQEMGPKVQSLMKK